MLATFAPIVPNQVPCIFSSLWKAEAWSQIKQDLFKLNWIQNKRGCATFVAPKNWTQLQLGFSSIPESA